MRPSKRRAKRQRETALKVAGAIIGGAAVASAAVATTIKGSKKKNYEDSLSDVKASDEIL